MQFDVYRNPRGAPYPLLLDLQSGVLARLATRAVAPLMTAKRYGKPITRLNPIVRVANLDYVVVVQELAAIPVTQLGDKVTSLAARRDELVGALDLLFTGL